MSPRATPRQDSSRSRAIDAASGAPARARAPRAAGSTALLDGLAASAPVGIFVTDGAGRCTYTNPRLDALMGLPSGASLDFGWLAAVEEAAREPVRTAWLQAAAGDADFDQTFSYVHTDGSKRTVRVRVAPLRDARGRRTGFVGAVEDVTATEVARERAALQAQILDELGEGVAVISADRRIRFANNAMAIMFGYPMGELIGLHIGALSSESRERKLALLEAMRADVEQHGRWIAELNSLRKDGSQFVARAVVVPIEFEGQRAWLAVRRDISERKRLESAVLRVTEAEQRAVANELHEGLGQSLTALALEVRSFRSGLPPDASPAFESFLSGLEGRLNEAIESTRHAAQSLTGFVLDARELDIAIRHLAAECERRHGLRCIARVDPGAEALGFEQRHQLYHILRAAIGSAAGVRSARHVDLQIRSERRGIVAEISDDGRAIAPDDPAAAGLDLDVLRHRANSIGATLELLPRSNGGLHLLVVLGQARDFY